MNAIYYYLLCIVMFLAELVIVIILVLQLAEKQAVSENHGASTLAEESQMQRSRDLKMKSEEETMKDGDAKAGEKKVKSEAVLEENGASSTTPSTVDIRL